MVKIALDKMEGYFQLVFENGEFMTFPSNALRFASLGKIKRKGKGGKWLHTTRSIVLIIRKEFDDDTKVNPKEFTDFTPFSRILEYPDIISIEISSDGKRWSQISVPWNILSRMRDDHNTLQYSRLLDNGDLLIAIKGCDAKGLAKDWFEKVYSMMNSSVQDIERIKPKRKKNEYRNRSYYVLYAEEPEWIEEER